VPHKVDAYVHGVYRLCACIQSADTSSFGLTNVVNIGMRQTRGVANTPAVMTRSHCHVATSVASLCCGRAYHKTYNKRTWCLIEHWPQAPRFYYSQAPYLSRVYTARCCRVRLCHSMSSVCPSVRDVCCIWLPLSGEPCEYSHKPYIFRN